MSFGSDADEAASAAMYRRCRDAGINFFDTADVYGKGKSEQILGKLIQGHRDELVIASKCHQPMGTDINAKGASRRHVTYAAEASLRRLGTDRLDVFFLHMHDPLTPLEEAMRAMEDLVRAGKILYPAVSNYAAWQIQRAIGIQERMGWARLQVIEPMYNLVKRQAEVEILPMAQANQVGVIPYSPVGGGLLSGKYARGRKPEVGRFLVNKMYQQRYADDSIQETAARFTEFCERRHFHPVSLAVAWVGSHPAVTAPIIGARNVEQLEASLKSVDIAMTPELRAEVSALSPAPAVATDRSEEARSAT
jgi:aryl-alcohol dehydrogenase-like predicted oxidoreductase